MSILLGRLPIHPADEELVFTAQAHPEKQETPFREKLVAQATLNRSKEMYAFMVLFQIEDIGENPVTWNRTVWWGACLSKETERRLHAIERRMERDPELKLQ
jgi:hypothetical protein